MRNGATPVPCYIPGKLYGTVDSMWSPGCLQPSPLLHPCIICVTSRALGSLPTFLEIMSGTILGTTQTGGR